MKAFCIILLGFGIAWTFFVFLLFVTEDYSDSSVSILYFLPGVVIAFLGLIGLKGRI